MNNNRAFIEQSAIEKKEKISVEILERDELKKIIYQNGSFPDNRFVDPDKGGVFYYFDLQELINPVNQDKMIFPVIKEGDLIVGIIDMEYSPTQKNVVWAKGVSVDPKYQGKGYASILLEKMFKYAQQNNLTLQISRYGNTGDGEKLLKGPTERLAKQYGVKIINSNK